jgi:hypothetical protein
MNGASTMTESTDTERLADPSISVDRDGNNNVQVTIWTDIINGEALRIRLSPGAAATLLRDLSNQVTYSLTGVAMSIARGDCETCRNTRMVQVPAPGGRMDNAHCPDCRTEMGRSGFPLVPQVGGGLA